MSTTESSDKGLEPLCGAVEWENYEYELNQNWFTNVDADEPDDYYVVSRAQRPGILCRDDNASTDHLLFNSLNDSKGTKGRQVFKAIRKGFKTGRSTGKDVQGSTALSSGILDRGIAGANDQQTQSEAIRETMRVVSDESLSLKHVSLQPSHEATIVCSSEAPNTQLPSLLDDVSEQAIKQRISRQFSSNISSATHSGAERCSVLTEPSQSGQSQIRYMSTMVVITRVIEFTKTTGICRCKGSRSYAMNTHASLAQFASCR